MGDKKSGTVDIQLSKPITIIGAPISVLRMREPTVGDQMAMDKNGGTPAEQELSLVANLCMVAPADLHQLSLKDYKKVQAALQAFVE